MAAIRPVTSGGEDETEHGHLLQVLALDPSALESASQSEGESAVADDDLLSQTTGLSGIALLVGAREKLSGFLVTALVDGVRDR